VLIGEDDHYDITDDRKEEAFVTMKCPESPFGQMEVYQGGTDRNHPVRLAVIIHRQGGILLNDCVYLRDRRAIVRGAIGTTPTVLGVTWSDEKMKVVPLPENAAPDCGVPAG
jgi:hypothetical protein